MIYRVLHFDRHDWKHVLWLGGRMINGYWKGDWMQMADAWAWICVHFKYDSGRPGKDTK